MLDSHSGIQRWDENVNTLVPRCGLSENLLWLSVARQDGGGEWGAD
jgi:hypothetical protein